MELAKPKKSKPNAFLMFLLEYRRLQKDKGNEMDMTIAQIKAGEIWSTMPVSERQRYSNKPLDIKQNLGPRYNSFGVSFDELDRRKADDQRRAQVMKLTILETLQSAVEQGELETLTFIFFSTSYFVQTNKHGIFPAEIALSKFSLARGVYDTLHMLIDPGNLPLGEAADATMHSKKTHNLPLPPNATGETDYEVILSKILKFCGCDKESLPVLYVEEGFIEDDLNAAVLTWEAIKSKTSNEDLKVRVYPTSYLLYRLYNSYCPTKKKNFSLSLTKETLARDQYQYSEIGCAFHVQESLSHFCCLSKVQRWGFMFADVCLEIDQLIPGQHFPPNLKNIPEDDPLMSTFNASISSFNQSDSLNLFSISSHRKSHLLSESSFGGSKNADLDDSIDKWRPTGSNSKLNTSASTFMEEESLVSRVMKTRPKFKELLRQRAERGFEQVESIASTENLSISIDEEPAELKLSSTNLSRAKTICSQEIWLKSFENSSSQKRSKLGSRTWN